MKTLLHAALAATFAHAAFAEVKVTVGDISDMRRTDKFFGGLEIELNLSGPELAEAKGIRTTLKSATDDTGKALVKSEQHFDINDGLRELQKAFGGRFEELPKAFGGGFGGDKKADEFQVKLEFANPPRSAKAIKALEGTIELLIPSKDPASIITASVAKDAGKPLENAALKAAGVQISLLKPGGTDDKKVGSEDGFDENDLGYKITDPNKKVGSVEFFDAAGKKLESNGHGMGGFNGYNIVRISFNAKPPADAVAKIYLVTDKSVFTVPLALKDIALP